jgi:hypothetical protein
MDALDTYAFAGVVVAQEEQQRNENRRPNVPTIKSHQTGRSFAQVPSNFQIDPASNDIGPTLLLRCRSSSIFSQILYAYRPQSRFLTGQERRDGP